MGMSVPLYHTADMVRALLDDTRHWPRYETVYGELLVTPAPRLLHQLLVGRLFAALTQYVDREGLGVVFASPADISWGADILVQPDIFVVPIEQARTSEWRQLRDLLLAVEVLSPGTLRADRFTKRRVYQEHGVSLYWIVDADACSIDVWTPSDRFPRTEREKLVWTPESASALFVLPLAELFRPV
ncbi:MAG: Uma2 family endonuclease [Gemmatimonadaceae bacterium]